MAGEIIKSESDREDEKVVNTFRNQLKGRGEARGGRDGSQTIFHCTLPFVNLKSKKVVTPLSCSFEGRKLEVPLAGLSSQ